MNHVATRNLHAVVPASSSIVDLGDRSMAARDAGRTLRIAALVRRHRVPVLITFAVCVALTAVFTWFQAPVYRAKAVIEVQGRNREFLNAKDFDPSGGERTPESFVATQAKLIRTETLAQRVTKRLRLNENPAFFRESAGMTTLNGLLHRPQAAFPANEDATATRLLNQVAVKPDGDSDLITITVDSTDAKLSADLANQLSAEYSNAEQEERWNSSVKIGKWLTEQLEDFRTRLQQSEDELQKYAQRADLLFTDEKNNVADEKLRQIQQDLTRAQADRAERQSQMEQLTSASPDSVPKVLDDSAMRDLTMRLAELRRQYAELSATLTPSHYKVQRVQAQIQEVEDELTRRRHTVVSRIRNEYDSAVRREKLLQSNYQVQARVVADQNARASRYNVLKREVETNRELYSSMLQKVKEASMLSAMKTNVVRIVDSARVPLKQYRPNLVENFGVGIVGFLMCSALIVLLRERADRSIRDPGEAARMQFRELGVIPSARHDPYVRGLFAGRNGRIGDPDSPKGLLEPAGASGFDSRLVTWTYSRSIMADAFRSVAMTLVGPAERTARTRVIVFTSPHQQAGKSTTVANVAIALADGKRRMLLIDGDLRRPQIHSLYGLSLGPGLVDLLKQEAPVTSADLVRVARHTPISGLDVISAGYGADVDPMVLGSDRFGMILARARMDYDIVLIDTPPVMHLPDARLIANHSDGIVLVFRAGRTSMDQINDVSRLLLDDGATILGAILNDWDPRTLDPQYFSSYYASYSASAGTGR